uniref:Uncharacterized protein n=1 Tax=Panagrolaimus sp. ES5 TaxID=591445 RepID=A0AC34G2V3_9BILA
MSNAMKFKSTQSSLYPIDKIAKIKTKKSRKNDKQQNAVPIYHCNKPYHEILKDSLINNIYLITAEPSNVQRLATLHFIHGHPRTLEDSCRFLGCYSFNDFIRKQEFIFCEFLEIFVIKTDKKINVTESPFLLNYYNNKIHQNQGLRNSMKEAMDEEPEPDRDRYLITFEQTKYFEFHNSLEYIDGRKKFAKVVEECRLQGLYNRNGYVTLNKFQQFCQKMFNANFSTLLKSWFPRCGGLENIMRKVIFEEIDCSFKSQKKENEFRIKPGCTIDEISQNLDLLKENITQFYYRIERDFSITASESTHQYDRRQRYGSKYKKRKDALTLPKPVENCFASSDEEAVDLRIENRPF